MNPRLRDLLDAEAATLDDLCQQVRILGLGYAVSESPGIAPLALLYDGDEVIDARGETPYVALENALLVRFGGDNESDFAMGPLGVTDRGAVEALGNERVED